MNKIIEILTVAKESFIEGNFDTVTALLQPLIRNDNPKVAGTAAYISGLAFTAQKNSAKAFEVLQKAVDLQYDDPALYQGYGASLQLNSRYDEAERIYTIGIEVCGRIPTLLSHWATIELIRGNASHAEELLKEALTADGNDHMGWTNLGNLFQTRGFYRDAVTCYKEAIKISPHYDGALSNLLLTSNYANLPQDEVFEAHKVYGAAIQPIQLDPFVSRKPGMKIRVGYLSGDFKTHSVAYFFAPIIQFHNRKEFEIFCYSDVYSPDPVTIRFQKQADHWRDTARMNNEDAAALIREDGIDILIDLAGHCGNSRLSMLRAKPAPVQVTWMGYPNTTGLPEIQYRIVDEITDPTGIADKYCTEELIRLNGPFLCYMPSDDIPDITELPAKKTGILTFGSCNNLAKISEDTITIWANLLKSIPNSRLKLKSKPLKDKLIVESLLIRFETFGIPRNRLFLEGHRSSNKEHLEFYNDIDIALDTFPYNGTTTTCESLFMGVPVLTILGDRHASRVSASLLNSIGHPELIANSSEQFVAIGKRFSENLTLIEELRHTLRSDFRNSPLADGKRICSNLEQKYKIMFERA